MFSYSLNLQVLRIVKEYKHVRYKTSVEISRGKNESRKDLYKHRSEIVRDILNCNVHTAREIVAKNKDILDCNHYDFNQNAIFCNKFLKLSDVIECPFVLTLQPSLLQHRYYSLKELGFCSVTPQYILRFPCILKEKPQVLKEKGFPIDCEHKCDILNRYLDTTKWTEVKNRLQRMYNGGNNLREIKKVMNAEFFAAKLECSIGKVHQMLHNYAILRVQSIYNTDQLINILLWKFGFPVSKICSSHTLLSIHHENVENFISEIPKILGVSTIFLIKKLPLILRQRTDSIRKVEAILKDFSITQDQLICCPKVLSIAPGTLHKRLTTVCSTEEFSALQSNKKFLWLVYNFTNLNFRLQLLKNENMPCSINMFTVTKGIFNKYLKFNNTRTSTREACAYLVNVFKKTEKEIFTRLHCYCSDRIDVQNFSALNCRKVIEFLLLCGVTKEQIFNGLEIVFYDIDTVKVHFTDLRHHHACQPFEEWISHYNFIQLLIYAIEVVDYHSFALECDDQDKCLEQSSF